MNVKQGDTSPAFSKRLRDNLGLSVALDNINEVTFRMRDESYNTVITDDTSGNVSVIDAATGEIEYQWQSGDTDVIGSYKAEFEIRFSDGSIETFPKYGQYDVEVVEDIND